MKNILGSLNLTESQKRMPADKAVLRRSKLISKLDEQAEIVAASLKGEVFFKRKQVRKTDDDGNQVTVTVPKRVNKWFYVSPSGDWLFEVKYGNKTLELATGKTAIAVGELEKMATVIDQLKKAVAAGELDAAISAVAEKSRGI